MAKITSLEVGFGADASDFAEAMDKAQDSFKNFHESLKDGAKVFEATRTPAERYEQTVNKLQDLLRKGAISQDTFNRAMKAAEPPNKLTEGLQKLVPVFDPVSLALKVFSAGMDIAVTSAKALADVLVNSVAAGIERLDAIDDVSKKLGISTEAISALRYAAGFADINVSKLDSAIGKMNVNIIKAAEGSKPLAEAFSKIGLDAQKLKEAGTEKAFGMIADAIASIPDSMERSARASEIFGAKVGKELLPLLELGSEGIKAFTDDGRQLNVVISDIDAAKVAEAADAMQKLKVMWEGVGNALAVNIAPLLETIAGNMKSVGLAAGSVGAQVSAAMQLAVNAVANFVDVMDLANRLANPLADKSKIFSTLAGTKFLANLAANRAAADARAKASVAETEAGRTGAALANDEADGGMGTAPIDFDPADLDKPKRTGSSGGGPASDIARRQLDELQKSRMIQEKIEVNTRGRAPVASID